MKRFLRKFERVSRPPSEVASVFFEDETGFAYDHESQLMGCKKGSRILALLDKNALAK